MTFMLKTEPNRTANTPTIILRCFRIIVLVIFILVFSKIKSIINSLNQMNSSFQLVNLGIYTSYNASLYVIDILLLQ
jgi:hypothetical protein